MSYDETYLRTEDMFGAEPERVLKAHYAKMNRSAPVLDIGAGQGRNAVFLARNGYLVDAIDPSHVAVETVADLAAREHLPIRAFACGVEDFVPTSEIYSGVLVFGLVQILSRPAIASLLERIVRWTGSGSLVFVTGFRTADAGFAKYAAGWSAAGRNSFANGSGEFRTHLEDGEILEWFGGYEVLHHWEGMGPEHRHGSGPLERHAMVELVVQRQP